MWIHKKEKTKTARILGGKLREEEENAIHIFVSDQIPGGIVVEQKEKEKEKVERSKMEE